jgi:hypothetical protein
MRTLGFESRTIFPFAGGVISKLGLFDNFV